MVLPLTRQDSNNNDHYQPYYLQAAATVLLLPLSCTETLLVVSTISAFRKLRDEEIRQKNSNRPRRLTMVRQNAVEELEEDNSVSHSSICELKVEDNILALYGTHVYISIS